MQHQNLAQNFVRMGKLAAMAIACVLLASAMASAQSDALPSWQDGPTKKAIIEFVMTTTDASSPNFVPPAERIAAFDQDGTTWVEQPMYPQVVYCLERLRALVKDNPDLRNSEPFKTLMSGDASAKASLTLQDLMVGFTVAFPGWTVEAAAADVAKWLETAKDQRFARPYTELTYLPMLELMRYLRANGYRTYIVTGGGQDFVRVFSERVYGVAPEQVVGTMGSVAFGYDAGGKPVLTNEPKLLLDGDDAGKPAGMHLVIGRRPYAAFGNSVGDRKMLEYTQAGGGARLAVLVHHDDAVREYAYGPQSKVGNFSEELMSQARQRGWLVVSMKNDWKRIFAWEQPGE
jgi:hypothetical protein